MTRSGCCADGSFVAYLPKLGTNLVTTLSSLNMNNFSHLDLLFEKKKDGNAQCQTSFVSAVGAEILGCAAIFARCEEVAFGPMCCPYYGLYVRLT